MVPTPSGGGDAHGDLVLADALSAWLGDNGKSGYVEFALNTR